MRISDWSSDVCSSDLGLPDTSPVPKKDPMGMDYVPVYADDAPPAAPGTVVLPPDKVQALGVRTEAVRRDALAANVRTSGTVEVDETRQYAIAPDRKSTRLNSSH